MTYLQKKKLAFMSIVNKVKGFVRTVTGVPPLTLLNCVDEDSVINYTISGESLQYGKNMITYPYFQTTKTQNGITFTDNGDGSITVNGTATANVSFALKTRTAPIRLDKRKKYTLSGCPEGGGNSTYIIGISQTDYGADIRDSGTGITFHPNYDYWYIYISVYPGVTVENLTFYPQLEEGSEATEYSLSQITPDAPIEVESVGEKTVNLFDVNNASLYGGYFSNGKMMGYSTNISTAGNIAFCISCKPNTTYTVSRKILSSRFVVAYSDSAPAADTSVTTEVGSGYLSITTTTNDTAQYLHVWFYNKTYDPDYTYQELMQEIQVEEAENLFDISTLEQGTILDASGSLQNSTTRVRTSLVTLEAGTYSISVDDINSAFTRGVHIYNYDTEKWEEYKPLASYNKTFDLSKKSNVRLIFNTSSSAVISPEDIAEENPVLTLVSPYEPYGYKIPVKASGKNLFDKDYWSSFTITELQNMCMLINTSDTAQTTVIPLGIGKGTYTFSIENASITNGYYYGLYDILDGKVISKVRIYAQDAWLSPQTITVTGELYIGSWFSSTSLSAQPIKAMQELCSAEAKTQIEKGNTATEYEPYVKPIVTNIYLDEPLRADKFLEYPKDNIPKLPTFKGTTIYSIETNIQPSNMSATYYSTSKGD